MGTNYYYHEDTCSPLHIGKSSVGWVFAFHSCETEYGLSLRSTAEWYKYLNRTNGYIENEYGEKITFAGFWSIVHAKKGGLHATELNCYVSEDNDFILGEFS